MKQIFFVCALLLFLAVPVSAAEYTAPPVPDSGAYLFPDEPESFGQGLWSIIKDAVALVQPQIARSAATCMGLIAVCVLVSIFAAFPGSSSRVTELIGTIAVSSLLLGTSNTMVRVSTDTIFELSAYGKLLIPVMAAAVAAQGGAGTSAALYTGTVIFDAALCQIIEKLITPMLYLYICAAIANAAIGQDMLKKLRDLLKWLMTWCLKTVLYIFVGYIGITGVAGGATDAAALKAAKLTISGMVPVVGGILSDASEAVLVSAGLMKSAAGIYGLLALIAIGIGPFIQIGVQYLLLKAAAALCQVIGGKGISDILQDFSSAMGLALGMACAVCLLLLISVVCFMKGAQ